MFHRLYLEATGEKPIWSGKSRAAADQLARLADLDVIQRRLEFCFRQRQPAFIWQGTPPDIGSVLCHFDKLVPVAVARKPVFDPAAAMLERLSNG